jgi:hypothetical protein
VSGDLIRPMGELQFHGPTQASKSVAPIYILRLRVYPTGEATWLHVF